MNLNTLEFIKFDNGRQLIWDASSLDAFKRCPRYYQYNVLQGWRPRETVENLAFGTALHGGVETYDAAIFSGVKHADATNLAVAEAIKLGEPLKTSKDTGRTLETLTRAVVWYAEQFRDDNVRTAVTPDGKPALEIRFEVPIPGTAYRFSGRIDKLATINNELYVVERKTTDAALSDWYFDRYSPNTQVSAYVWALSEFLGVPINGVMIEAFQTGVSFTRIQRGIAHRTRDQIAEFVKNTATLINHAEEYHNTGFFPMNESACMIYGGCKFRPVCERPEQVRPEWLKSDFEQRGRRA